MSAAPKAHVRAGRLVLHEPTTLPEGSELSLIVEPAEDLDASARQEIDALLEEAESDRLAGRSFPAEHVVGELEPLARAIAKLCANGIDAEIAAVGAARIDVPLQDKWAERRVWFIDTPTGNDEQIDIPLRSQEAERHPARGA